MGKRIVTNRWDVTCRGCGLAAWHVAVTELEQDDLRVVLSCTGCGERLADGEWTWPAA